MFEDATPDERQRTGYFIIKMTESHNPLITRDEARALLVKLYPEFEDSLKS